MRQFNVLNLKMGNFISLAKDQVSKARVDAVSKSVDSYFQVSKLVSRQLLPGQSSAGVTDSRTVVAKSSIIHLGKSRIGTACAPFNSFVPDSLTVF